MTQDGITEASAARHRRAVWAALALACSAVPAHALLEIGSASGPESIPAPAPQTSALTEAGPDGQVFISPSEAARDSWRQMVCEGGIETSVASAAERADHARSPSGTLLPPSLAPDGFVAGWETMLTTVALSTEPAADAAAEGSDPAAAESESASDVPPQRRFLPFALAFMLPAFGSYAFTRNRKPEAGGLRSETGVGLGYDR